jgi:predicted PurR-regulated permease PerM
MPRWIWRAVAIFWAGWLVAQLLAGSVDRLSGLLLLLIVSLFLALAIEPGVDALARRGWRRGGATGLILLGVVAFVAVFVTAIGTMVGNQVADLLRNSEDYVERTVQFLNNTFGTNIEAQAVNDSINDPSGPVQQFIRNQQDRALRLSVAVLGGLLQFFSVLLFTFYLVADGPRLRRAVCSRLAPERQVRVLGAWELAIRKTGGYLGSRALLAALSAFFHWVVFQAIDMPAPVALALWVGLVSQFLPVVGTYIAGALPLLLAFLDAPTSALVIVIFIVVYQQIENYLFSPRITARAMDLHPAVAFGAAIGGAALIGPMGAVLALPAAAMITALVGAAGPRHEVVIGRLTEVDGSRQRRSLRSRFGNGGVSDTAGPGEASEP